MLASFTDALGLFYLLATGQDIGASNANGIKQQASTEAPPPSETGLSTACGDLIDSVNEGNRVFFAEDVYDCLTSVPFDNAIAQRFISYYNETLQFQSTLAYVGNPPEGYQQPAFDVTGGLERIKRKAAAGGYANQYEFEAELEHVVYSFHDAHVDLYAGALSAFSFGSPYNLVSASKDGQEEPKIYLAEDVLAWIDSGAPISAVESINGETAVDYMARFAALNSIGMVEPHADWNQVMHSPVQEIHAEFNIFSGGGTFYPGDELNFTLEDGRSVETYWLAIYNNPDFTGPLRTGADFFNYFVLGLLPDDFDDVPLPDSFNVSVTDLGILDATEGISSWNEVTSGAYPNDPDVVEAGLDVGGGVVTGYFLEDISTGVLSLPSFDGSGDGIESFIDAVDAFIVGAKEKDISKVVIDLQQNYGGTSQLGFVTFRQFFPRIDPFAGSRRRSHPHGDALGSTMTSFWDAMDMEDEEQEYLKRALAADEWVITNRINAETGGNFTSWAEYFGPREDNGDQFSLTERYDLANRMFDAAAFDGWIPTQFTDERIKDRVEPWNAEDIVILTDGTCSSTCAMFLEMMTHEAGVRTVVVGGQPKSGPMQAASGSRGARLYSAESVDKDMELVKIIDEEASLPAVRDAGMFVFFASLNLRDQMRPKEATPLQFQYLPADCRLYWTLDNVYNMTRLWRDVAAAAFDDNSLCVPGSTGLAEGAKPAFEPQPLPEDYEYLDEDDDEDLDVEDIDFEGDPLPEEENGLQAAQKPAEKMPKIKLCKEDEDGDTNCKKGTYCQPIRIRCGSSSSKDTLEVKACVPKCHESLCPPNDQKLKCARGSKATAESKATAVSSKKTRSKSPSVKGKVQTGFCIPSVGTTELGCPKKKKKTKSKGSSTKTTTSKSSKSTKSSSNDDEEDEED